MTIIIISDEPSNNSTCTPKPDGKLILYSQMLQLVLGGQYCLQRNVALGAGISSQH